MTDIIRDERGHVVAHLKTEGDTIRLQDARYRTLGYYSKTRDITTDRHHHPVGRGNVLLRLVPAR